MRTVQDVITTAPSTGKVYTTFSRAHKALNLPSEQHAFEVLSAEQPVIAVLSKYLRSNKGDTFVFNGEAWLITLACFLKLLTFGRKARVVAVDMVLRAPRGPRGKAIALLRKVLWKQVDRFIHYFRDIKGFTRHYGISEKKSTYVPFKSNIYAEAISTTKAGCDSATAADGAYIFSAGRSLRDYQTLIEAARINGLPTAILFTSLADWAAHGTHADISNLPNNVRLIRDEGGKEGWISGLAGARIVAIPTLPESLCASGIGTYLDAMALGKPVVITRGPGADDVLDSKLARFVPAQNPQALADQLQQLWNDRPAAAQLAANGRDYALSLGDESSLLRRIFAAALE